MLFSNYNWCDWHVLRDDPPAGISATNPTMKQIFSQFRLMFIYIGVFTFVENILLLAQIVFWLQVFDRIIPSHSVTTLVMLYIMVLVAMAIAGVFDYVRSRLLVRIGVALDTLLGRRLLEIQFAKLAQGGGTVNSRESLRDLTLLRNFISGQGSVALFNAPWGVLFMLLLFVFHLWIGVLALAALAAIVAMTLGEERATKSRLAEANQFAGQSNQFLAAATRNTEAVRAMWMIPGVVRRWRALSDQVLALQTAASSEAAVFVSGTKTLRHVFHTTGMALSVYLILSQNFTSGLMIAAMMLFSRATGPAEALIRQWRPFVEARQAYGRIDAILRGEEQQPERMELPEPRGTLQVERLKFAFKANRPVLRQVSFSLVRGECLGIIGPSGAGKSTLARLILGLWAPTDGAIRLDGAEISQWPRDHLGQFIGYLPQDVELFSGTIAENIARLQDPHADSDAVVQAAKLANAHRMILKLPDGYDTEIGEGGAILSGGQRQRIGLARALYGNPQLVVLDEPNSNLDRDGERALATSLQALKARKVTTIVITHNPRVLEGVDKILVLSGGTVQSFGPPSQIIAEAAADASAKDQQMTAAAPIET
jgi:ATP-binding cassette, subfamily C, bacterial EexD